MRTVILNADSQSDLNLLLQFAKRLGIKAKVLSKEDMEDHVFAQMIDEEKTGEDVSRDEIMKKLSD